MRNITVWLVEAQIKAGGISGRKWVPIFALYESEADMKEVLREWADDKNYRNPVAHLMMINKPRDIRMR